MRPNHNTPNDISRKQCSKCLEWLPATTDYFHRRGNGFKPRCKSCRAEDHQIYRQHNGDKIRKRGRRYYRENREKEIERVSRYHKNHQERTAEYTHQWYKANKKRKQETRREWREQNREKERLHVRRRRARKRKLPDTLTTEQWESALAYFNGHCAVCGRPPGLFHTLAMDHWIPLSSDDCPGTVATNAIPLCHGDNGCNNSKLNKLPHDWLAEKFGKRKAIKILARIEAYFEIVENERA